MRDVAVPGSFSNVYGAMADMLRDWMDMACGTIYYLFTYYLFFIIF